MLLGTEFTNQLVTQYLQQEGIKHIHPSSDKKASIIERFNKTLQILIYKYLTQNQTSTYIDKLAPLLQAYNVRRHRTIKMTPSDAELNENQNLVLAAHNEHYSKIVGKRKKAKFKVGQRVLIKSLPSSRFHRSYHKSFNDEQFEISAVKTNMPIPMYILKSLNDGEIIQGGFYAEEIQPIRGDVYKVEKVIRRRTQGGRRELYVKWVGFSEAHNSWIPAENVVQTF